MRKAAPTLFALFLAIMVAMFVAPAAANADNGTAASLDARSAAGVDAKASGIGVQASWYSGSVAAGGSQSWHWNNANPLTAAYKVGFAPAGASTSATCQFEVTRDWYIQQPGGEREFHFTIKNIGSISCGTQVLLSSINAFTSWSTGGVSPGVTQNWHWNNANPLTASHLVGLSPLGSTGSTACQFEVTRTWYVQQPGGEREFHFTVKNVGTITCTADIRLASQTTTTSWSTGTLSAGASGTWHWNNANPLNLVYVPGLSPLGAAGASTCQLEITREYYLQRINADGSSEREFYLTVKNVGALACSGTVLLASVAA
ncbi:hypothetical protein [Phytomonospora endophytica]|uniref:Uncharacterized protein n=1 Tax=Phytomonospora endophytica TaxID=714109 RepID=A0A841FHS0_9ACTN|nr:hypothetical protein [Phytomonospora endophytica]MBB6036891.1 hypothetical protein [Phytomonospora endophytica]GIG68075.1 hypothetical protein Pen01_43700 [Phytomonospora endophytica]